MTNAAHTTAAAVIIDVSPKSMAKMSVRCAPPHRSMAMVRLRSESDDTVSNT